MQNETFHKIAIFASGNGSNAENIIRHFREADCGVEVALIVSNRKDAGVLRRADRLGVESRVMTAAEFKNPSSLLPVMEEYSIDLVVLAGFLLMIPPFLIERYPGRIVNIHPSLLPKYGGKGMYGHHVHEAVVNSGDKETGITIHLVNEHYDDGRILFQAKVPVCPADKVEDVEAKIHKLEKEHFAQVIHTTFFA